MSSSPSDPLVSCLSISMLMVDGVATDIAD
jgi:hypothetical protein